MRYDAFISYSHRADLAFAPRLQSALRSLAKPWWRLGALAVFRDETDMGAASSLSAAIVAALHSSRFFVLLASTSAAASPWVAREVELWFARAAGDGFDPVRNFLMALTDGDIVWDEARRDFDWTRTDALPRALAGRFAEEPLWIDLRPFSDEAHLSLRHPDFARAVARLAAPMRGTTPAALIGEDLRRYRQARRWAAGAAATVALFAVGAGIGAWYGFAGQRRAEAAAAAERQQREIAERTLEAAIVAADALVIDVGQGLLHIEGIPLETIKGLLDKAERIFAALDVGAAPAHVRFRRAVMFDVLATAYVTLGDGEAARQRHEAGLAILKALVAADAANLEWRGNLVIAHVTGGRVWILLGDIARAEAVLREGVALGEAGAALDASGRFVLRPLAIALIGLGDALLRQGKFEPALAEYRRALPVFERLDALAAGSAPMNAAAFARDVAVARNKIGEALMALARHAEAEAEFRLAMTITERNAGAFPRQTEFQRDLFVSHIRFGRLREYQGRLEDAIASYEAARAVIERLLAAQPNHPGWQRDRAWLNERIAAVKDVIEARKNPPRLNDPAPAR